MFTATELAQAVRLESQPRRHRNMPTILPKAAVALVSAGAAVVLLALIAG